MNKINKNTTARSQSTIIKVFLNIILLITVFIVLYPIAFTIGAAFTRSNSLASTSIVPWPKEPSLYQFQRLLTPSDQIVSGTTNVRGTNYITWYKNTLKIAIMNTILTVILCTTTGYIFSRFKFGLKKPLMASMIVLQLFPSFIGMIATYVILWRINGLDTHWGLVLVYATGSIPYNSWLMKGYFDSMPRSIEEAARVDGASPFGTYLRIIVPSARPQIVFLTLVSFTGPWMDFIFPRLVLRSDTKKTLAVGLFELINGRANDNFTMFAAGALLVAIPFAILFIAGQKNMLLSLAGDGLKE
jgi:arabinogalactan oligomer/maltooligosaccharide transport system permease protein